MEWRSWSGLTRVEPVVDLTPHDTAGVVDAVRLARERELTVKMVGSGHSFTAVAEAPGVLLRPEGLSGITAVDRTAMTVTARAGTPLRELNAGLAAYGLSLHNMGDVDVQTLSGAVSTGTHGTGGRVASLSAQVVGLEMVTADGEVLVADAEHHRDVLAVARLGLGALGILTRLTMAVEPLRTMLAEEIPARWEEALDGFDETVASVDHAEMYWFPHTDHVILKANTRTDAPPEPLPRWRRVLDDEVLSNGAFGLLNRVGNAVPRAVPRLAEVSGRALSARRYSDLPYRVFTSPRRVVFKEMEYAVPRAAGLPALREARRLIEQRGWAVSFPVEVRVAPGDDVPLSAAYDRDVTYLAFHVNARTDHTRYFAEVEALLRDHDGRPHWGKLHSRTAADLAPGYPRWGEVSALRGRLDPDRVFANDYLRRVLGP